MSEFDLCPCGCGGIGCCVAPPENCVECGHSILCHDGFSCDYPYDGFTCFSSPVGCQCRCFMGEEELEP